MSGRKKKKKKTLIGDQFVCIRLGVFAEYQAQTEVHDNLWHQFLPETAIRIGIRSKWHGSYRQWLERDMRLLWYSLY